MERGSASTGQPAGSRRQYPLWALAAVAAVAALVSVPAADVVRSWWLDHWAERQWAAILAAEGMEKSYLKVELAIALDVKRAREFVLAKVRNPKSTDELITAISLLPGLLDETDYRELGGLIRHPDREVRLEFAEALANIMHPLAGDVLGNALSDPDWSVRRIALEGLLKVHEVRLCYRGDPEDTYLYMPSGFSGNPVWKEWVNGILRTARWDPILKRVYVQPPEAVAGDRPR